MPDLDLPKWLWLLPLWAWTLLWLIVGVGVSLGWEAAAVEVGPVEDAGATVAAVPTLSFLPILIASVLTAVYLQSRHWALNGDLPETTSSLVPKFDWFFGAVLGHAVTFALALFLCGGWSGFWIWVLAGGACEWSGWIGHSARRWRWAWSTPGTGEGTGEGTNGGAAPNPDSNGRNAADATLRFAAPSPAHQPSSPPLPPNTTHAHALANGTLPAAPHSETGAAAPDRDPDRWESNLSAANADGAEEEADEEVDEETDEALIDGDLADRDWVQQMTRRHSVSEAEDKSSDQIEWFLRHQWTDDEQQVDLHFLFQPAFPSPPQIDFEVVQGSGSLKIGDLQAHGLRLELRRAVSQKGQVGSQDGVDQSVVWLLAQQPIAAIPSLRVTAKK